VTHIETGPAELAEFGAGDPFKVPVAANADAANPESLRNSRRVWSILVWSVNVCSNQKGVAAEYYVDEACGTCGVRFRAGTAFWYITRNWRRQASRC